MKKYILFLIIAFSAFWFLGTNAANAANNWYCSTSAQGSVNGTSWANTWACNSVPWGSVSPGDTVYIDGGTTSKTYTANADSYITVGVSGTSNTNRVTLRIGQDAGHNGVAIIDLDGHHWKGIDIKGSSWVTVDGEYNGARHIKIQNGVWHPDPPVPGQGWLFYAGTGTGQLIKGIEMMTSDSGLVALELTDPGAPDVALEISNCHIHDIRGDAVIFEGLYWWPTPRYDAVLIHHNILQGNHRTGLETGFGADIIQGGSGSSIYNNEIYGAIGPVAAVTNHQDGLQAGNSVYFKVYNNYMHDLGNACFSWDRDAGFPQPDFDGYLWIYNNICTWTTTDPVTSQGIETFSTDKPGRTVKEVRFFNNLIGDMMSYGGGYNARVPIQVSPPGVVIHNNMTINCGALNFDTGSVVDYNLSYPGGPDLFYKLKVGGVPYTQPTYGPTSLPSFVSYVYQTPSDYHLTQNDTVAKGKGINLTSYCTNNPDLCRDKDGNPRPSVGNWDIGVYEYTGSPPSSDTTPPSIPINLSAAAVSSSQINLSWTASTDNVRVTGYRIYRGGTQIGTSATNSYSNTGLIANTTYSYTVSAYDAAGNVSAQSSSASATTPMPSANIEAESGTLVSPMQIVSDSAASGNAYIMTPTSESGTAVYSFSIASAGTYKIVARVYAENGGMDSYYFKIDNSAEDTWDLNPSSSASEYNVWREDEVTARGTGTFDAPQYDPYTVNLTSGNHTITFRGREINAKLDYFRLVMITDTTPPAAPTGLAVR